MIANPAGIIITLCPKFSVILAFYLQEMSTGSGGDDQSVQLNQSNFEWQTVIVKKRKFLNIFARN